jgi:Na+-transporting NADH:ubiquinone oxidoreductase subunit C
MFNPITVWRGFLARPNDDRIKIFGIATFVALVCSALVSITSVTLKPIQDSHRIKEQQARLTAMLEKLPALQELAQGSGADNLETKTVNLETGEFEDVIDDNNASEIITIPSELDIAGLRDRSKYATVYLLQSKGSLRLIVLPVSGVGYQSEIHAMLALEADLTTIAALTITDQGETPGLGSRIEEPIWQSQWQGIKTKDETGTIVVAVARGQASTQYEVDGISGATRTGNGVANMLRYWLGAHGYGPFLNRLEQEGM